MPEDDAPVPNRLSILHPVRSLRILLRSPAYRLAARHLLRRVLIGTALAVVVVAIWWCSATPAIRVGYPRASWVFLHGFYEYIVLTRWRVAGISVLVLLVAAVGAMSFARERRSGSMEQLVMTPTPRCEVVLARALSAFLPAAGAVLLASCLDLSIFPYCEGAIAGRLAGRILSALCLGSLTLSACLFSFCAGFYWSLRMTTVTKALAITLLPIIALAPAETLLLRRVARVPDFYGHTISGWPIMLLVAAVHLALAGALILLCVKRFDRMALGEIAKVPGRRDGSAS